MLQNEGKNLKRIRLPVIMGIHVKILITFSLLTFNVDFYIYLIQTNRDLYSLTNIIIFMPQKIFVNKIKKN